MRYNAAFVVVCAVTACSSCRDENGATGQGEGGRASAGGSGGTAGAGGLDGSKDALSEAPAEQDGDSLIDQAVWSRLPDDRGCEIYSAKTLPDPFPRRAWAPCGPACEIAETGMPPPWQSAVRHAPSTIDERGGEIFLRLTHGVVGRFRMPLVSRLSDGVTLGAIQIRNFDCSLWGWSSEAAHWFIVADQGAKATLGGHVPVDPSKPIDWSKWFLADWGLAATDFGNDEMFGVSDGQIRGASIGDAALTKLDVGDLFHMAADGKLVIWQGYQGHQILKGFTKTSGAKIMWQGAPELDVISVAASERYLAWSVAEGFTHNGYNFTKSWLYWTPNTGRNDPISSPRNVELPFGAGLNEVRTGGDYAVTYACAAPDSAPADCGLHVIRFSTEKLWTIRMRPGKFFVSDLMAISDTYLAVGEVSDTSHGDPIESILRYRIDGLDEIAQ